MEPDPAFASPLRIKVPALQILNRRSRMDSRLDRGWVWASEAANAWSTNSASNPRLAREHESWSRDGDSSHRMDCCNRRQFGGRSAKDGFFNGATTWFR